MVQHQPEPVPVFNTFYHGAMMELLQDMEIWGFTALKLYICFIPILVLL